MITFTKVLTEDERRMKTEQFLKFTSFEQALLLALERIAKALEAQ